MSKFLNDRLKEFDRVISSTKPIEESGNSILTNYRSTGGSSFESLAKRISQEKESEKLRNRMPVELSMTELVKRTLTPEVISSAVSKRDSGNTVRKTDAREVFETKKEKGTAKKVLGKEEFKPIKTVANALLAGIINLARTTAYKATDTDEYNVAVTGMTKRDIEEKTRDEYSKNIENALERTKGTPLYGIVKLQEKLQGVAAKAMYGTETQKSISAKIDETTSKTDDQMISFLKNQEKAAIQRSGIETGGTATRIIGGAAQSLPASMATRIPILGWAMMFNGSFQNTIEQELEMKKEWSREDVGNILIKATANAALEIGTEMIFPLFGKGFKTATKGIAKSAGKEVAEASLLNATKGLVNLIKSTSKELAEPTVKNVAIKILSSMIGEGAEEGINYIGSAYVSKITTDKDKVVWANKENPEAIASIAGMFEAMASGALMAGVTGVRHIPNSIRYDRYKNFTETIKEAEKIKDKPIDKVTTKNAEDIINAIDKDMENPENVRTIMDFMFESMETKKAKEEVAPLATDKKPIETTKSQTQTTPQSESVKTQTTMPVEAPTTPSKPVDSKSKVVRPSGQTVSFNKPVEAVAKDLESAPKGDTINSSYTLGKRVDTVATVLPATSVIPSMDADLNRYDVYDAELQPRNVERADSATLVNNIASKPVMEDLFRKETIGEGIPVVDQRGMVVAGNHRVAGILKMMRDYPANYEAYKQYARDHASELGLTPEQLQGDFIVTRVLPKGIDAKGIAYLTNVPTTRGMSPTEIAQNDSKRMTDKMLSDFVGREDGLIDTKDNRAFIQGFMSEVIAPSELNKYQNKDGNLNADGIKRIVNAIFHRAYGDTALLDRVAESTDNDIKRVTTSMVNVAPALVEIQEGIKKGNYYDIDLAPLIKDSAEEWVRMKESGDNVQIYATQVEMGDSAETIRTKNMLFAMDINKGSAKKLTELYTTMITAIKEAGSPNQVSLFGDITLTIDNVINTAKKVYGIENTVEVQEGVKQDEKRTAETAKQPEDRKLPAKKDTVKKETGRKVESQQEAVTPKTVAQKKSPVQDKAVPKVSEKGQSLADKSIKEFGRTQKYNEAGYILPSGIMLDFSEKSDGGEPNVRTRDHREVSQFYKGKGQTESMNQFIKDTGAIRIGVSDDVAFVDLIKDQPLTQQQLYHIGRALSLKPRVTIDVYESADKNVPIISEYMENPLNKDISKFIEDAYANEKIGEKETESYEKIVADASEAQDDTGKLGIVSDAYLGQQRTADVPKTDKKETIIDYNGVEDENVRQQFDNSKRPVKPIKESGIIRLKNIIRDNFLRASVPEVGFEHGQVRTNIIKLRKRFAITSTLTWEEIKAIYNPIGSRYKNAMDYAVFLPDLVQDIELGKYDNQPLPFGFESIQQVIDENARLKVLVNDPMDSTIKEALKRRSAIYKANQSKVNKIAEKLGVDFSGFFTRTDYVHHAIMEYVENTMNNPTLKRSAINILRSREGGQKAYITDSALADFLALQKLKEMQMKLSVLSDIKDLDITKKLSEDENGNLLIPEGYIEVDSTLIQFTFPEHMLKTQAVNTANAFLEKFGIKKNDPLAIKLLAEANKTHRNTHYIIPIDVAKAYASMFKNSKSISDLNVFDSGYRKVMGAWKAYALMSPRRAFTYQLRNTISDFSKTIGFMPKSIEYVPKAVSMLTKYKMDKGTSEMLLKYIAAGGLEGGLTNIELGDYKALDKLNVYNKDGSLKPLSEIFKAISKPMNGLENFYQWREQIFRFAGFMYFYEKGLDAKTNQPIDGNYRGSKRAEIQSMKQREDIAYKMSNDIVGAYDDTTPFTNFISRRLQPFFRFQETNNKTYLRGLINTFYSDPELVAKVGRNTASKFGQTAKIGAYTAMRLGKFVVLASLVDLVLDIWNKIIRKEEDEQTPSYVREQSHITLGKFGDKIYYLSNVGSLREALEWIGFSDPYNDFRDLAIGKMTYKEKIKEIITAPYNMMTESVAPLLMPFIEAKMGKTYYTGQYIRDPYEHIATFFQLEPAYKAIVGKAQIDGKYQWNPISFQKVFENETYFWDIYTLRDEYYASIGKPPPSGGEPSKEARSKALYELRTAIRYKDEKAGLKYLAQYIAYGGDLNGIKASASGINPLQRMNKTDRENFVNSLTGKDKEIYDKGMAYYDQYSNDMEKFFEYNKDKAEEMAKEIEIEQPEEPSDIE